MSTFYGRRARLVVQNNPVLSPTADGFVGPPNPPPKIGTVITTPLRIQFKVEKQLYTPPNTADISVTNLSGDTRKKLQQFGAVVILEAGYSDQQFFNPTDGQNHLPTLFMGTARTIDHVRKGAEWVTRIQCGDGELAYRYAQAQGSWAPGTSYAKVAGDIAEQLKPSGIDVQQFLTQLQAGQITFPEPQFPTGYAASGNALQELIKLLGTKGWAVSIQNGQLQAVAPGGRNARAAPLISQNTGMLGSPEHGTPDKNGLQSVLKVKSLLLPQLGPGDPFVVQARANSGSYVAQKVTHSGDSHGVGDDSWSTEIEAYPL